jgi:hypothetical protein
MAELFASAGIIAFGSLLTSTYFLLVSCTPKMQFSIPEGRKGKG